VSCEDADVGSERVFSALNAAALAVDELFDAIAKFTLPGLCVLFLLVGCKKLVDGIYTVLGQLCAHVKEVDMSLTSR
jgi:hypothetical protein